ncbi:MAG: DUF2271 domain-containing protein [Candidatus Cloacimonetes bacterium]|nr:DUF2271 domain-containing protein [Candidatus Cloacimonadota bacterium]
MKKIIILVLCIWAALLVAGIAEDMSSAEAEAAKGNLKEATLLMEKVVAANPGSADALAQYGLYLSQQAGQAGMMEAGELTGKAFEQYERALAMEPEHINARLYRGILSVNIPKFFGKLEQGLADLEYIQKKYSSDQHLYMVTSYYLGIGQQKAGNMEKAKEALKFVVTYGRDTQFYEQAKAIYDELSVEKETQNNNSYEQGMKSMEAGDLRTALEYFRQAAKQNPDNLEMHLMLARTLGTIANQGYDETIQDDVTDRAGIANEVFEVLSHCVELAPGDEQILFLRGSVAIYLPFFVNSLETGIADMTYLSENGSSDEMKGKAEKLLKEAIKKRDVNKLAEAGYLAETEAEREELLPQFIESESPVHQMQPEGDYMKIEMRLGYRDQIAPQTAVWIEDINGNYIKTLYISSFAAFVKEKQEHLSQWADKSKFEGISAVTSASIDCGKHIFYWDFTDTAGRKINSEEFVVCAEICHWPHVQYRKLELPVDTVKENDFKLASRDFLIPELTVTVNKISQ